MIRFVELYGETTPKLAEEDTKIFDLWMENWIEQRQNDFYANIGAITTSRQFFKQNIELTHE